MADTPTARNRLRKLEEGAYQNSWAPPVVQDFGSDRIDDSLDGVLSFALSGAKALTGTNFVANEARMRVLNITGGTGGTVTILDVEKWYLVRNGASGDVIIATSSGSVTIAAGNTVPVFTNGTNVYAAYVLDYGAALPKSSGTASDPRELVTLAQLNSTAFSGALPGQSGNAGRFLTTNGTAAAWALVDLTASVTGILPAANGGTGYNTLGALKTGLSLNNVENKSSATIRGEFTAAPNTFAAKQTMAAPAAGSAGFNLQIGTAPTSPVAGDFYPTATGLFLFDGTRALEIGRWTQIGNAISMVGVSSVVVGPFPLSEAMLALENVRSSSASENLRFQVSNDGMNWGSQSSPIPLNPAFGAAGELVFTSTRERNGAVVNSVVSNNDSLGSLQPSSQPVYGYAVAGGAKYVRLFTDALNFTAGSIRVYGK